MRCENNTIIRKNSAAIGYLNEEMTEPANSPDEFYKLLSSIQFRDLDKDNPGINQIFLLKPFSFRLLRPKEKQNKNAASVAIVDRDMCAWVHLRYHHWQHDSHGENVKQH